MMSVYGDYLSARYIIIDVIDVIDDTDVNIDVIDVIVDHCVIGDDVIGDDVIVDDVIGDDVIVDDVIVDDVIVDDVIVDDDSPDSTLRVARDSVFPAALEASTWKTPASEGWHLESVNEDPEPEVWRS